MSNPSYPYSSDSALPPYGFPPPPQLGYPGLDPAFFPGPYPLPPAPMNQLDPSVTGLQPSQIYQQYYPLSTSLPFHPYTPLNPTVTPTLPTPLPRHSIPFGVGDPLLEQTPDQHKKQDQDDHNGNSDPHRDDDDDDAPRYGGYIRDSDDEDDNTGSSYSKRETNGVGDEKGQAEFPLGALTPTSPLNSDAAPFHPPNMMSVLDRVMASHAHLMGTQEHSCHYCGLSHLESVGQCSHCQKWFCNESGSSAASHLLTHLIASHHGGFKHHPDSTNADIDLECYFCSTRNIFLLGTINSKEDNFVAIVCRTPCLLSAKLKEQNFDVGSWTSIIQNKKFVPWLLHPVPPDMGQNAVPITTGIINKLEEMWVTAPQATIGDLYQKMITLGKIQQLPDSFPSSIHYANSFHPLVNIEAESDRLMKFQQYQEGLSIQWITTSPNLGSTELISLDTYLDDEANKRIYGTNSNDNNNGNKNDGKRGGKNNHNNKNNNNNNNGKNNNNNNNDKAPVKPQRLFAAFTTIQEEETALKIFVGDELVLQYGDPNDLGKGYWVGTGFAVQVKISGEIIMSIDDHCLGDAPTTQIHGYRVNTVWKSVMYDRMHVALSKFGEMTGLLDEKFYLTDKRRRLDLIAKGGVDDTVTIPGIKLGLGGGDSHGHPHDKNHVVGGKGPKGTKRGKKGSNQSPSATATTTTGTAVAAVAGGTDPAAETLMDPIEPCMSLNLYHQLLGLSQTDEGLPLSLPEKLTRLEHLPALNQYQEDAIQVSVKQTLTLLQGPPGTGKTTTCAYLIHYLLKALQEQAMKSAVDAAAAAAPATTTTTKNPKTTAIAPKKIHPILVCAPSNIAVDHLAEKLHLAGLKVVRVSARSRQNTVSTIDFLSLHVLVGQLAQRAKSGRFYDLYQLVSNNPMSLSPKERQEYKKLVQTVSIAILQNADVICTTCTTLGDNNLFQSFTFERVLIDEATQCPEPEILIPLTHGAKQVILVGDHCQLGPVVLSRHASKAGYNRSLFERLLLCGHVPKMLQIQYRMHPEIAKFPTNTFYDGSLTNGLKAKDRTFETSVFPWPNPTIPLCFIASTGSIEEYSASGTSYINRYELSVVEKCLLYLVTRGITLGQIGIITPYEGQRLHLMSTLTRPSSPVLQFLQQQAQVQAQDQQQQQQNSTTNSASPSSTSGMTGSALDALVTLNNLEIASVDSFQGREKDVIIFTCVRSNEGNELGFLSDPRRLNVALTRAKYGMIMIGNPKVLLKNPLWHALLCHFKIHKCFVEGGMDLDNLKPCNIIIPPSKTFLNARNIRIPVGFDPRKHFGMKNVLNFNRSHQKVFHSQKNPTQPAAAEDGNAWDNDLYYKQANVGEGAVSVADIDPDLVIEGDLNGNGPKANAEGTAALPTSLGR